MISVVVLEQIFKIADATLNIFRRVETVGYSEAARRRRNQLHQAQSPLVRNRERIVIALDPNDGVHEIAIHVMLFRDPVHKTGKGGRRFGVGGQLDLRIGLP